MYWAKNWGEEMSHKKCFPSTASLVLCSGAWLMFKEAAGHWTNTETNLTVWNSAVSCWFTISQKSGCLVNSGHHHDFCSSRPFCSKKKQTDLAFTVLPVAPSFSIRWGVVGPLTPLAQGRCAGVQTPEQPIPVTSERKLQIWLQRDSTRYIWISYLPYLSP